MYIYIHTHKPCLRTHEQLSGSRVRTPYIYILPSTLIHPLNAHTNPHHWPLKHSSRSTTRLKTSAMRIFSTHYTHTHTLLQRLNLLLVVLALGLQQLFHQDGSPVKGLCCAAHTIKPKAEQNRLVIFLLLLDTAGQQTRVLSI